MKSRLGQKFYFTESLIYWVSMQMYYFSVIFQLKAKTSKTS